MLDPGLPMEAARIVVGGIAGLLVLAFLIKFVQFYFEARRHRVR